MSLATALLGLASCSQDEGTDNTASTADLQLTAEISTTRGIIERTQFTTGDSVNLFVAGAVNSGMLQATAINDGGSWVINPTVKLTAQRIGLVGLMNVPDTIEWGKSSIAPDAKGDQPDILVGVPGSQTINAYNPRANLTFYHLLSRVSFNIKQLNGTDALTRVELANVGDGKAIGTEISSVALVENAWSYAFRTEEGNSAGIDAYFAGILSCVAPLDSNPLTLNTLLQLSEKEQTISLLVLPTTIDSNNRAVLRLTINDAVYSVELPYITWRNNVNYQYPITIDLSRDDEQAVTIGTASIDKWNSIGEGSVQGTWNMN
jgi:hypothetical protein